MREGLRIAGEFGWKVSLGNETDEVDAVVFYSGYASDPQDWEVAVDIEVVKIDGVQPLRDGSGDYVTQHVDVYELLTPKQERELWQIIQGDCIGAAEDMYGDKWYDRKVEERR